VEHSNKAKQISCFFLSRLWRQLFYDSFFGASLIEIQEIKKECPAA